MARRMNLGVGLTASTGEIAALVGVAARTVTKWIDSGKLPGFRLPLSLDRRVMRSEIYPFLVRHGLRELAERLPPEYRLGGDRIVLATQDGIFAEQLRERLQSNTTLEVVGNFGDACEAIGRIAPTVVVVDFSIGYAVSRDVCRRVAERGRANLFVVGERVEGFDGVCWFPKSDPLSLVGLIEQKV